MLSLRSRLLIAPLLLGVMAPARSQDLGDLVDGIVQGAVQSNAQRLQQRDAERQGRAPPGLPAEMLPPPEGAPDDGPPPLGPLRYAVDGHLLGETIAPNGTPRGFACTTSDQFAGSTWCRSRTSVRGARVATSILISSANRLVYHSKVYEAAEFAPGGIASEIDRLSRNHHARPRILRMPADGADEGIIAVWGTVALDPVDGVTRQMLADGSGVNAGILVDFLNNARESARRKLPVFRLGGGPGYLLAARVGRDGRGSLRFGTSDAAGFDGPPVAAAPGPSVTPPQMTGAAPAADDEKAARARQEVLDRLTADARRVLDNASRFVKADPTDPGALDLVQAISDLGAAVTEHDAQAISRKASALSAALRRNPHFGAFEAQQAEELKRRTAQQIGEATRSAQRRKAFLTATLTADPTSPDAGTLLPLIRRLDAALASPELARLDDLNAAADSAIRQAGLSDKYALSAEKSLIAPKTKDAAAQSAGSVETGTLAGLGGPPMAEASRILVDGDPDDVLLLYNALAKAPHVGRNLRGDVVFGGDTVTACLFDSDPDAALADAARAHLASYGVKALAIAPGGCDAGTLTGNDIVALRRGAFPKLAAQYASVLTAAVDAGAFRSLAKLPDREAPAAAVTGSAPERDVEADVMSGSRAGSGAILLQPASVPTLCMVTADRPDAHRAALQDYVALLRTELGAAPAFEASTLEKAFADAKRSRCGAIYAIAADLRVLAFGLRRDGAAFRFAPLWVTPDDLVRAADGAGPVAAAGGQRMAGGQRAAEEQHPDSAADGARASRQAALRAANEKTARAAAARIEDEVRQYTAQPSDSAVLAQEFPQFSEWLEGVRSERWTLTNETFELADYGMVDWKGRSLAVPMTKVVLQLRNAEIGGTKGACFVFGRIDDAESNASRDPIVADCGDAAALSRWRNSHAFMSRWIVN